MTTTINLDNYDPEHTVFVSGREDVQITGTLHATTLGPGDTGTDPTDPAEAIAFRNRRHLVIQSCRNVHLDGVTIIGPRLPGGPGKSAGYALEGQAGITIMDSENVTACNTAVRETWGNNVECMGRVAYGMSCTGLKFYGCDFGRNGRQYFKLHGVRDLVVASSTFHGSPRSNLFHVEAGMGRVVDQGNWLFDGNHVVAGAYFMHITGGARTTGIRIQRTLREDQPLTLYFDAPRTDDGCARVKDVLLTDNLWDRPQTGGYFWLFRHVDGALALGNEGPVRKIYTVEQQIVKTDSTNISVPLDRNNIWRAA